MTDIDDLLDERMTGGTGDYPPWFDEEDTGQGKPPISDEGDTLQGRVTQIRDDPFFDPSEEEKPKPILHVHDQSTDEEWSTRTHTVLVELIRQQEPEVGDLVRIEYGGAFKTDKGQMANDYKFGVVRADELDDVETATADGGTTTDDSSSSEPETTKEPETTESPDEPEPSDDSFDPGEHTVAEVEEHVSTVDSVETLEELFMQETTGSDRKTAKAHIQNRKEEIETDTDETTESDDEETSDVDGEVIEFTESLLSFHGELTFDELDEYLNETRDFNVDPSDVAEALDAEVDGDVVREA